MSRTILAYLLVAFVTLSSIASLSGCNTMEGAGKDVQQGGKAIKDEANEHK
jgi:predicted small secreted protein